MSSKETFSAGQTREFYGDGDFFRLLQTTAGINVEFFYQGREVAEMIDVEAGYAESFARDQLRFDRIRIYSATAQDVKWVIREGSDVRYDRGAATVGGSVDLNPATLAALETTNVRPEQYTGKWYDVTTPGALSALTVFTPGSNVNGAILLEAQMSSHLAGTAVRDMFCHGTAAPVTMAGGEPVIFGTARAAIGAVNNIYGELLRPVFIPPGHGLYYITDVAMSNSTKMARYKLL